MAIVRMTSLVNDCGPIYGKVFRYDIHAVTPITFTWPNEDLEDEYYSIYRDGDVVDRHTSRIKIKKSITLATFFDIIERMTPNIVFVFSKFMQCGNRAAAAAVERKPNNSISTLIYGGNDLNLEQVNQWFPSLKYLYVYKLKTTTTKSSEMITMPKLETLSCWYCDNEIFKLLSLPNLVSLDVYRFTSIVPPSLSASCSRSSDSSSGIIDRFPRLTSLRIDARQMKDVLPALRLKLLQYYRVASDKQQQPEPSADNLLAQIAKSNASDMIVPPGLSAAYISSLHNRLQDTIITNEMRLGVYVDDQNLFEYTRHFDNMQIFDSVQPLKVASIRQAAPLHLHLPKEIDRNILTHLRHLNGGTEQHHKFLLSNFNIFTDANASPWINLYKSERFVYICALEIVLDDEEKWPTIVKTTKNRVFVINAQRTDVFLDINAKPMFTIAKFLLGIHRWVKFTNVHLLTRGDDRTQNENYAEALQKELARDANINVYKYSAPATIIVA